MIGSIGLLELVAVAAVALCVLLVAYRICTKAGFPGYLALAALVPIANLVLALYLAFARWPIEAELDRLRAGR